MAYPTISDVKTYIGKTDTNSDDKLTQVLNRAIKFIENECGQVFAAPATFSQTTQGDGSNLLRLAFLPISEITSIIENGITLTQGFDKDYILYASSPTPFFYL